MNPSNSPDRSDGSNGAVPTTQKVSFGLGSINDMWGNWLYPSMAWPVFNMFLGVSPALVSTALMVNRLVDAVTDPLFGWLSDNTRSRFGRRRPYILVGSILSGLTLPFLFTVDPSWGEQSLFWYMVLSTSVMITFVSMFNMPYQSLGNEMTPDYQERVSVFAYKGALQKIGELGMFFAAAFITLDVFADPESGLCDSLKGAQVYAMILGAAMILIGVFMFFTLKERYYQKVVDSKQDKVKLLDTLWKALQCKPFVSQLAMALAYGMGTSMVGSLGYYLSVYYVCGGDVALGSKWNFAMGLSNMIMGLLGVPFFAKLTQKKGKKTAMMYCQFMGICAFACSWFLYNPSMPSLQLAASGLIAFTQGGFWMIYGSIGADVIDYDEWQHETRREGVFAACGTYIMKIGLAIGMGLSGMVLQSTGFDAGLGTDQDPAALDKIRLIFLGVPIAGLVLAYGFLLKFGLNREDIEEIRAVLEKRRGEV